jgi:dUTPase
MKYTYMKDYIFYPMYLWIYNWILKVTAKNIEYYLSNTNHSLVKANNSDACYAPGTIDSSYRGEVKVILYNTGVNTFNIVPGDRIAQVKFDKVPRTNLKRSNTNFSIQTDRGQKGFGSSGK